MAVEHALGFARGAGRRILGKHISAHSLRHAFATAAIKAGWSAKKVASQLGHSSTAITLDMYVEEAPSWQDVEELWGDLPPWKQKR